MLWHMAGTGGRLKGQGLRSICFMGLPGAPLKTLVNIKFISRSSIAETNTLKHSSTWPAILLRLGRISLTGRHLISDLRLSSQASSGSGGKSNMNVTKDPMGDSTLRDQTNENKTQSPMNDPKVVSRKDKLKQAVKDYGLIVIGFHITISLISLGFFYLLVSSGIDVVELLRKIGIGEHMLEGRMVAGASTFVVAYAIHKVFAPGRIAVTLAAAPVIVNKLRKLGILKKVGKK